jgi:hypothetical protein
LCDNRHSLRVRAVVICNESIRASSANGDRTFVWLGERMKLSTMSLVLCFAVAPVAARTMVQHRDTLHQIQRHAMPISAIAFVPAVKLGDNSDVGMRKGADIESNEHF